MLGALACSNGHIESPLRPPLDEGIPASCRLQIHTMTTLAELQRDIRRGYLSAPPHLSALLGAATEIVSGAVLPSMKGRQA